MSETSDSPLPALEDASTFYACPGETELAEVPGLSALAKPPGGNGKRAPSTPAIPLRRVLEAVLFAVDRPVTVEQMLFAVPGSSAEEIEQELRGLSRSLKERGAGFEIVESGGGYELRTDPDLHDYVTRFLVGKKRTRLSRAAMETLAIVAYRQPITRGEAEEIRGVDCGQVLHTLLDRGLVTIRGRSQALGRPLLYATTEEFLHYFGINSLADLPSPEELGALLGEDPLQDPEVRDVLKARGLMEDDEGAAGEGATGESADGGGGIGDPPDGDGAIAASPDGEAVLGDSPDGEGATGEIAAAEGVTAEDERDAEAADPSEDSPRTSLDALPGSW